MTGPRRRRSGNRSSNAKPPAERDLWRPVSPPEEPEPITPSSDPTALLRSLGSPPFRARGVEAEHYLIAVVERAAGVATALAASADLLARTDAASSGRAS